MEIAGARVIVTGGARGLGRTFALDLAGAGARVGVCDVDAGALDEFREAAAEAGLQVWTRQTDVADEASVEALFEAFVAEAGGIDAVVNNAGLNRDGLLVRKKGETIEKLSLAKWQAVIDVDLTGVFLCAREAAYHMVAPGDRRRHRLHLVPLVDGERRPDELQRRQGRRRRHDAHVGDGAGAVRHPCRRRRARAHGHGHGLVHAGGGARASDVRRPAAAGWRSPPRWRWPCASRSRTTT